MASMHPAGRHLHLLMQQANDTAPIAVRDELFDTQLIPVWEGAPLLPPVERTRYIRPRRFDRWRTFLDTNPVVDAAFYLTALTSLLVSLAALGAL
jgi:hypothetical protein